MSTRKYIPERGDLVYLDFDPVKGHEQGGRRPGLVVSNKSYNSSTDLFVILPITSKIKNYPFEVLLESTKIKGVVLCDQINSKSWVDRNVKFIEKVNKNILSDACAKSGTFFNF